MNLSNEFPKVSIITVAFNSSKTIHDTLKSVTSQNYENIEHIIIDGASTDGTLDIIKEYGSKKTIVISEKDSGIYNAMNKGLEKCSGDIICFLNSDDTFWDENSLTLVIKEFKTSKKDCIYSDVVYINQFSGQIARYWETGHYYVGAFYEGWHPPHPGFFARSSVYKKHGGFDESFSLAADFEIMFRFLESKKVSSSYLPIPIVKMKLGGATNKSSINIIRGNIEIYNMLRKNDFDQTLPHYLYKRWLPKLKDVICQRLNLKNKNYNND